VVYLQIQQTNMLDFRRPGADDLNALRHIQTLSKFFPPVSFLAWDTSLGIHMTLGFQTGWARFNSQTSMKFEGCHHFSARCRPFPTA